MPTVSNPPNIASQHDAIAQAAYLDWVAAGKPTGRDHEFWLQAEQRIRSAMQKPAKGNGRKVTARAAK